MWGHISFCRSARNSGSDSSASVSQKRFDGGGGVCGMILDFAGTVKDGDNQGAKKLDTRSPKS